MPYSKNVNASVVDHSPDCNERKDSFLKWGLRPQTPGIYRFHARIKEAREQSTPSRAIPAAESALRSHPCVAVPSAQVFPAYQLHANSILQVLRTRVYQPPFSGLVRGSQDRADSYPTRPADAERPRGKLQRASTGRVSECKLVRDHRQRQGKDRIVERGVQR